MIILTNVTLASSINTLPADAIKPKHIGAVLL
jgi:hypothetical protein